MSNTPSRAEPTGAVRARREGGARAADGSAVARRRRGMLPLLGGLAALGVIGILLAVLLGGSSSNKNKATAGSATNTNASVGATSNPNAAGSAGATPSASAGGGPKAQSRDGNQPSAGASASARAELIGGGGVAARPASGALAPAGGAGAILFAEAGTALDRHARAVLATAAQDIKARRAHTVNVVGYTDTLGNKPANAALSLHRARVVAAALRHQLGNFKVRFHAVARGESHPVGSNTTPAGRQLNRRVVIFTKT